MAAPKDMYMQFADVSVELDSATSTATLVTDKVDTGLSIRGNLIWLIHLVEILFPTKEASASVTTWVALSTRSGLTTMPQLGDPGCVFKSEKQMLFSASGLAFTMNPICLHYLPPIPIAAPALHLYARTDVDNSNLDGEEIEMRLGFTTTPLNSNVYTEIAETWGWT